MIKSNVLGYGIRNMDAGKTEFSAEEDAHVVGDCVKVSL